MEIFLTVFGAIAAILLTIIAWPALREFANVCRKGLFKTSLAMDDASDMAYFSIKAEAEESIQENVSRIKKVRSAKDYVDPKKYLYQEVARTRQLEKELKIF